MKKRNQVMLTSSIGNVPPHAIDLERAVLGCYLLEKDAYALNPISPEIFYNVKHIKLCEIIKQMNDNGEDIDLMLVSQKVMSVDPKNETGGIVYITELTGNIVSATHIQKYIAILKHMYIRRKTILNANLLIQKCYDTSSEMEEVVTMAEHVAMTTMEQSDSHAISIGESIKDIENRIENNLMANKELTGVPYGLIKADEHTGGGQAGDLTIVAAYPGDGKTSFVLTKANNAAKEGIPIAMYSLEMPSIQLTARISSINTGIPSSIILNERMSDYQINTFMKGIKQIRDYPIYFDDKVSSNINTICNSIRKMVIKFGIKEAIVDYIQLCDGEGGTREEKVSNVTRKLKSIAKELNIHIMALSQFNRQAERTEPPKISNLRESGAIEQDADNVIILWRPGNQSDELSFEFKGISFDSPVDPGITRVDFAKGRNIGTTKFLLQFHGETTKFDDYISDKIDPFAGQEEEMPVNVNFYEKDNPFE